MSVFKCKMCGGTLEVNANETTTICEYCGTQQTLPKLDNDRKTNLYDRANHFRRNNDYDKAMSIYEQILNEDNTDAEAYWSIVLCRYGIEYVEDTSSHKRIPTVNRAQFTSIYADEDYKSALQYADISQKVIYETEAKAIDEIQKGILAISQKEEPFDVFICYKENDANGRRTHDSVLANDLYYQLTQEGFKVFFARITLEDKLGTEYEPYIFAALNSAKAMVVLGTKSEYFNAVWVKNEWSRYLSLVKSGEKKVLIPAYRDMDPYDLPEEFSHLQAQDMSKLGFMQDLTRGIKKILASDEPKVTVKENIVTTSTSVNIENVLKRGMLFIEDGKWDEADRFFEQVLNENVEEPRAYLGKLLSSFKATSEGELVESALADDKPLSENEYYKKAYRFAGEEYKLHLVDLNNRYVFTSGIKCFQSAKTENDFLRVKSVFDKIADYPKAREKSIECVERANECVYSKAEMILSRSRDKAQLDSAKNEFGRISEYKDAAEKAVQCEQKIKKIEDDEKNVVYNKALRILESDNSDADLLNTAISYFTQISGWKDAAEKVVQCKQRIKQIEDDIWAENERKRIEKEKNARKRKKIIALFCAVAIAIGIFLIVLVKVIFPNKKYNNAVSLMNEGKYNEAMGNFYELDGYKDSNDLLVKCLSYLPGNVLCAGDRHTVGLKSDGTVVVTGKNDDGEYDASDWNDIIYVSSRGYNTVGLKSDGTVVATPGGVVYGQCDVLGWNDIVAVSSGSFHTVGLKSDGTVVAIGKNDDGECDVSDWNDIVAVSAGVFHTVGLKSDGTVVATGSNYYGECDVSNWRNIVAVSAGNRHTVGLKSDGTVVAIGNNDYGECNVSDWKNIIAVSAGYFHTVGLKIDGTVVATGENDNGECDVFDWKKIIAVSAGNKHTVGLKSDGTVVAIGENNYGQCNVSEWNAIKTSNN